jgi:DNA-binding MarR family transcriptional regulator
LKKASYSTDELYNLWTMLEQVHSGITLARDRELEQHGLSTIKASALFIVQSIGNEATPAEISRWILRRPHSVSGLLDRMEKDGLIKKAKNLHKKNLVRVTITPKGKKGLEISAKRKTINQILNALSEDERKQLYIYLDKLRNKALKVAGITHKPPFPPSAKSR